VYVCVYVDAPVSTFERVDRFHEIGVSVMYALEEYHSSLVPLLFPAFSNNMKGRRTSELRAALSLLL
jgi:hypothetical protein